MERQEQDDPAPVRENGAAAEDGGGGEEEAVGGGGGSSVGVEQVQQGDGPIGGNSAPNARRIVDDGSSDDSDGDSYRERRGILFYSMGDAVADLPGFAAECDANGFDIDLVVIDRDLDDDDEAPADLFEMFVTMLRRPEIGRVLGSLYLEGFLFDTETLHRPSDLDRLFGEVFLSHPALKTLRLVDCTLPSSCLNLLSSIPTASRLRELDLERCNMDHEGLSQLVSMIRQDGPLRILRLHPKNAGLDPDDCRILCESVCLNRHLRRLDVKVKTVHGDTLANVAQAPGSPLRALHVTGAFTEEGVLSLARQLRTNTRLHDLILRGTGAEWPLYCRHVADALDTYNYTLRLVWVNDHRMCASSLRRNRWIRAALRRLEPRDYRVAPASLWPRAFETVGAFHTLLYRLLRRGNVDALCGAVMQHRYMAAIRRKRGRSAAGNEG